MKKLKTYKIILLLPILFLYPLIDGCRQDEGVTPSLELPFNMGWEFYPVKDGQAHGLAELETVPWEAVVLPHTPRIEPLLVNAQWQGLAWYRKRFTADKDWRRKRVLLRFEAAMNQATVYMNGERIFVHQGGYLPFVVDLSNKLKLGGVNTVLVRLDNRDNPITGPKPLQDLDFNTYGGLYRGVSLMLKNPLHITDAIQADIIAGGGIFVRYPEVSAERASIEVMTHIKNSGDKTSRFRVHHELRLDSMMVAERHAEQRLHAGADTHDLQTIQLKKPRLWSPGLPNLYTLTTKIVAGGDVLDQKTMRIGIREIRFTKEGFFINGEGLSLRGVNRHQEYPFVGYAISPQANYRDAIKIKEAGFNFVRLSHYPHSPSFMRAADELGLLVLNAILGWQYFNDTPSFKAHAFQTCRDLIRRDRNHPSVIAWECSLNESDMPESFMDQMDRIVGTEYPGDQAYSAGWREDGYDIFLQARQHRLQHPVQTDKPHIVSEYGDWEYYALNAGFNQTAWRDLLPVERSSRQLLGDGEKRLLQQTRNIQEAHNDNLEPSVSAIGDAYWVMFDYNRGYAPDLESSGVMSIMRLPKYSFYFFQSQRDADALPFKEGNGATGPMVYIASYWDEHSAREVRVFSNCDRVELFLNEESLGIQSPDRDMFSHNLRHPPFTFSTPAFVPGRLRAIGYIHGRPVAEAFVSTPGAPTGLGITVDRAGVAIEDHDLVFVHARILDRHGTLVPVTGEEIGFFTEGSLRVLNPGPILTEAGIASALVRVQDSSDKNQIRAESRVLSISSKRLKL